MIKEIDETFALFIEDGMGRFVFCHLPFWGLVYLILWGFVAFLGPYILMLMIPGVIVPLCFHLILTGFYTELSQNRGLSSLKISAPLCAVVFITLFGIPGFLNGLFFSFIRTKAFGEYYWWALKGWWDFFNHINYFAKDTFPGSFYGWNIFYGHIVFVVLSIAVTVFFFYLYHDLQMDEAKKLKEEQLKAEEEAEEERQEQLREEERQRQRAIREAQEKERREKAEAERQEKLKEVTTKDPWDSGFL